MRTEKIVASHYSNRNLTAKILNALKTMGITEENVTTELLSATDEFHIGGIEATKLLANHLSLNSSSYALDIGCGIGGPARFMSNISGCNVAGIDLTPDYVNTGNELTALVGLDENVELKPASALSLPFQDSTFDASYMIHVGMNIGNKAKLMSEAYRVTKLGGTFGIYDVMLIGSADLIFPLPWAEEKEGSSVSTIETYKSELDRAGFKIKFFEKISNTMHSNDGPPPLGLHLLMDERTIEKVGNIFQLIKSGTLTPVIMIAAR